MRTRRTPPRQVRLLGLRVIVTFLCASAGPVPAEERVPPDVHEHIRKKEYKKDLDDIPIELRKKIVSKAWIIEKSRHKKTGPVSLPEAGNPHIRKGFLLRGIQDDPGRSRVDTHRLRAAAIERVERRHALPRPAALEQEPTAGTKSPTHLARTPESGNDTAREDSDPEGLSILAWFLGAGVVAAVLTFGLMGVLRDR